MSKIDFNSGWQFQKDGQLEFLSVDLPHDAMIHEQRDPDCSNAHNSGFYPGGKYTYKKLWEVSSELSGKQILLEFEGVYWNSQVFVNGQLLVTHPSGYLPFIADCSEAVVPGSENEIVVTVDNSKGPNSRWYTGSGIYRPVNLIVKGACRIEPNGIRIKTISHIPTQVRVDVAHTGGEVEIEIYGGEEKIAHAGGSSAIFDIADARLWSDETPDLYRCRVAVKKDGELCDEEWVDFGIRSLSWSTKGFFVNGKETKLRGACIHHDNGVLGACAFEAAEERKIRILKESGFNAIRSSHNPCSEALLRAADRHGVYVMDEFSDVWYKHKQKNDYARFFDEWYERDLAAMVERDFNHPSVIMYSIGNEIGEVWEDRGIEATESMVKLCHSLDSTRPVTCGTNLMVAGMAKKGIGVFAPADTDESKKKKSNPKKSKKMVGSEFYNLLINIMGTRMDNESKKPFHDKATAAHFSKLDIAGYNYAAIRYAGESGLYPDRIVVGTETRPPNIVENWRETMKHSHVIGDFMWTGWDYLGEAGIGAMGYASRSASGLVLKKYPYLFAGCGVIDICGMMRPEVWLNRAAWGMIGNAPYIGVEPVSRSKDKSIRSMWRKTDAIRSWTWHGYEGNRAKIVVYSNAASVELLLNGQSLGKKAVENCAAHFKTKYQPGELVAVNFDEEGKELGRDVLKTAGKQSKLVLEAESGTLRANGQDLCYIDIYLTDEAGAVVPIEDKSVTVAVTGAGVLQGLGSADPYTEEGLDRDSHKTYYGRAQAVVRAGYAPGKIELMVSAEGMAPRKLTIDVTAAS